MTSTPTSDTRTMKLLVFSHDSITREKVKLAVGRRPAPELPRVEWVECATHAAVIGAVEGGDLDVLVLDGEAVPHGGIGMCRQLKDEIYRCPPVLVLVGREQDRWLAHWSRADAVVAYPLEPMKIAEAVAGLMRRRLAASPATRS